MNSKTVTGLAIICFSLMSAAEETRVKSKTISVGLFKNGIAVVKRQISVSKAGLYLVEDVPDPIHGTYWIESDAKVVTRVTRRKCEVAPDSSTSMLDWIRDREVTIHLHEGASAIKGTVLDASKETQTWSREYKPRRHYYWAPKQNPPTSSTPAFLTVKTETGVTHIDARMIAYVEVPEGKETVTRMRPVLLFQATDVPRGGATIQISYLTKGLTWAPSYRIDLQNDTTMALEQKAIIKNELSDLGEAKVFLISGYPNVEFSRVSSPLTLQTTLSSFFKQLATPEPQPWNGVATQMAVTSNSAGPATSIRPSSNTDSEHGVDIHYQAVGQLDLREGDSLATSVAKASTAYQQIVEWKIPDNRNAYGRYNAYWQRRRKDPDTSDEVWTSIRFSNPFDFPMTTAPAMIEKSEQLLGQVTSHWVNPKEETVLHITKALSIKAFSDEIEVSGKRETVRRFGHTYERVQVEGILKIKNTRDRPIDLLIHREFSGKLLNADGHHEVRRLKSGIYSVNERNQCTWELKLAAGEGKTLKYSYSVLVMR